MKIVVTSDNSIKDAIRKAINDNGGYCPCKIMRTANTKCICKEFKDTAELGPCHCGLYIKME